MHGRQGFASVAARSIQSLDAKRMTQLDLLPQNLRSKSISPREIVLPLPEVLEALDLLESHGIQILGWEGWVKDGQGRVGHGSAPQGLSTGHLSVSQAADLCRRTIPRAAEDWLRQNATTDEAIHFCVTVRT